MLKEKIIMFFKDNPYPDDKALHHWAEKNGFDIHEVETEVYTLATKFVKFLTEGKSVGKVNEKDFDSKEIELGIDIEYEHIKDKDVAKRITLDHLVEHPKYYSKYLLPAEKQMELDKEANKVSKIAKYLKK